MAWASVGETLSYTGITVTDGTLESAQGIIDIFSDVTEDASDNISQKNQRLLRQAVAYQAAWITEHPDVFTHMDVNTLLQDGIQFSAPHANFGVLAPLAKRCIDRLSWKRNRSQRVRRNRKRRLESHPMYLASIHNTPRQDDDVFWDEL